MAEMGRMMDGGAVVVELTSWGGAGNSKSDGLCRRAWIRRSALESGRAAACRLHDVEESGGFGAITQRALSSGGVMSLADSAFGCEAGCDHCQ